jgi:hypothetical protein
MSEHTSLLLLCFMVALCVNYVAHRVKGITRNGYGIAAVGLISGFASFLISLMILTQYSIHWVALGVGVTSFYSYFMANAKVFENF